MPDGPQDAWALGDAYEPYVGRWSRVVAREFIAWLKADANAQWLDVGCGTGALTETILAQTTPARVQGIDPSPAFIAYAQRRITDPRAEFMVGDAQSLRQVTASIDVVVSALALNFVPHPAVALAEMARVSRVGGTVALYVWDYAGRMELMRHFWDATVALDANAAALDEGRRFPMCNPDALAALFRVAGLRHVEVMSIDAPTRFTNFDDYWSPFLGGQGPAPGYLMKLDDDRRSALREHIRSRLPIAADGTIDLIARAWAIRGTRM